MIFLLLQCGCISPTMRAAPDHRSFFSIPEKSRAPALPLLLNQLQLREEDLGIRLTVQEFGSLAVPLFRDFMARPMSMQAHAVGLHGRLCASRWNLHTALEYASAELLSERFRRDGIYPRPQYHEGTKPSPTSPVMRLIHAADRALHEMEALLAQISPLRRSELLQALEEFLIQQPDFHPVEHQKSRREKQRWIEEVLLDLAGLDRKALLEAALLMAREVDSVLENGIMPLPPESSAMQPPADVVEGEVLFFQPRSNGGRVIIGGSGPNTYHLRRNDIVVDVGGDDRYIWEPEPGGGMPVLPATSIIIDMSGDDIYLSSEAPAQGAGILGIDILVDMAGNDQYLARHFAQGCGIMGVGILLDGGGNDRYLMDTFGQAAGSFGVGLLIDRQGNDVLQARMLAQGVGFTGGAGLLVDGEGNDQYSAGQAYPDHREERQFTKSLSQGFGMGIRDYAPGGIGVLLDCSGNDLYLADYFGQGASYWLAVGLLMDASGNDRYIARRYVQGAGIHFSAGALVDMEGDDLYTAWGVAQGCGHDYAVGLLWDEKGNDVYSATWLSQGAGNSQGVGILVDAAGDDLYDASGKTVQGSAAYSDSRGAGSIGVFLDGQGNDHYKGRGRNGAWWRDGKYGGGGDFSGLSPILAPSRADLLAPSHTPSDKPDIRLTRPYAEIFAELELDLSDKVNRDDAVRKLAERGVAAIPGIISYLDIRDVFTQITIAEAFRAMDPSVAAVWIEKALEKSDPWRSPMLLYLLGEIGGEEALRILRFYLKNPEKKERSMAMRGIWRMGALLPTEEMAHLASDESESARRFLAHVLGRAPDFQSLRILRGLLSDRDYNVRFAAEEALASRGGIASSSKPEGDK